MKIWIFCDDTSGDVRAWTDRNRAQAWLEDSDEDKQRYNVEWINDHNAKITETDFYVGSTSDVGMLFSVEMET